MSNTIRRTTGKSPFFFNKHMRRYRHGGWVKITPEEFNKEIAKHHSETGYTTKENPSKWYRTNEHRSFRMFAKTEIIQFYKDAEYEVQIRRRHMRDWW